MNEVKAPSGHAWIGARFSHLDLTVACPGSGRMEEQIPVPPETEEELEGQLAHLVAMGIASHTWAPRAGDKREFKGRPWEIDQDMIDGGHMYAGEAVLWEGARWEDPVDASHVIPQCWGTPDYWRLISVSETNRLLKVVEYKYGFRHVDVFENPQMIGQALGVQQRLQLPWDTPVCLTIVQPRAFHHEGPVREWATVDGRQLTLGDLYHHAITYIVPAVREAIGCKGEPRTFSGPHCVDCHAAHVCPTYRKSVSNVLRYVGKSEPEQLPPDAIGVELRLIKWAIKMLQGRETTLKEHTRSLIEKGTQVPYWTMAPVVGHKKWNDDVTFDDMASRADLLGVDIRNPPKLCTPTQAKQRGLDESIVNLYSHRPTGGRQLVPTDDKQFRKVFGHASKKSE